jgi:Tol biopolymer transport system component
MVRRMFQRCLLIGVALVGCGTIPNVTVDGSVTDTNGQEADAAVDAPGPPRCNPSAPFGTPQPIGELNSTGYDGGAWVSADERTVYFTTDRGGPGAVGALDVYRATRSSRTDPWGAPTVVPGINTTGLDIQPRLTADGLFLYLTTYSQQNGYDLVVSQRGNTSSDFPPPMFVPSLNPNGSSDADGWILPDNSAIYFHSNRDGGDRMFRATRNGGAFEQATPVMLTNVAEASPVVSADELTIYFGANTGGGYDVYMATRPAKEAPFNQPVQQTTVNTSANEYPSWVSNDGCVIYFDRPVTGRGEELFQASRGQ